MRLVAMPASMRVDTQSQCSTQTNASVFRTVCLELAHMWRDERLLRLALTEAAARWLEQAAVGLSWL